MTNKKWLFIWMESELWHREWPKNFFPYACCTPAAVTFLYTRAPNKPCPSTLDNLSVIVASCERTELPSTSSTVQIWNDWHRDAIWLRVQSVFCVNFVEVIIFYSHHWSLFFYQIVFIEAGSLNRTFWPNITSSGICERIGYIKKDDSLLGSVHQLSSPMDQYEWRELMIIIFFPPIKSL